VQRLGLRVLQTRSCHVQLSPVLPSNIQHPDLLEMQTLLAQAGLCLLCLPRRSTRAKRTAAETENKKGESGASKARPRQSSHAGHPSAWVLRFLPNRAQHQAGEQAAVRQACAVRHRGGSEAYCCCTHAAG